MRRKRSHGRVSKYNEGCRCAACRGANRAYYAAYRKRPHVIAARRGEGLKGRYGLTVDGLTALIEAQGGVCKICRLPLAEHKDKGSRTHVDHDPRTGKKPRAGVAVVRGVLCHLCNQGLGKFRDDPEVLDRASAYVRAQGRIA